MSDTVLFRNLLLGTGSGNERHELESLLEEANIATANNAEAKLLMGASAYFVAKRCTLQKTTTLQAKNISPQDSNNYPAAISPYRLMPILKRLESKSFESYNLEIIIAAFLNKLQSLNLSLPPVAFPLVFAFIEGHKKYYPLLYNCSKGVPEQFQALHTKYDQLINWSCSTDGVSGSLAARKLWLTQYRKSDSTAGRAWLQDRWEQEDAATKAGLLEALETNISLADEAFLTACLAESLSVKRIAARLLTKLAGSAHQKRMQERLQSMMKKTGFLLDKKLEIVFPETFPATWADDGVEIAHKSKTKKGDQALSTFIQYIHPTSWKVVTGEEINKPVEIMLRHPQAQILLQAFQQAVLHSQDEKLIVSWATVAIQQAYKVLNVNMLQEAFMVLSFEAYQQVMLDLLEAHVHGGRSENKQELVLAILARVDQAWGERLSNSVMKLIEFHFHKGQTSYLLRELLVRLGYSLSLKVQERANVLSNANHQFSMLLNQAVFLMKYRALLDALLENN